MAALFLAVAVGALLWPRAEPERAPPSVLVITLDTTRADAVGRGRGTPAIEEFLAGARHFERARTVAPLTLPSHLSLFSGLTPIHHGIHDNVTSPLPVERGFPLLAEEFTAAGYATAAFVSCAVVAERVGIGAGFATYSGPEITGADLENFGHIGAEERAAEALAWLDARPADRPFFAWVHFFDPHAPYLPYAGDGRRAPTPADADARALYAGEVRRMDAAIERVLAAVPADTIVILVTDHGEGLGDNGEPAHGPTCFGSVVDAFLAVRAPAFGAGGDTDPDPRSLIDVAPTLRKWCGLAPQPSDGRPLDGPGHEAVVSESLYTWRMFDWGQCFSVSDGRFTLVECGERVELFDRAADPGETEPLEWAGHPAYERLDRVLVAYRRESAAADPVAALFDSGTPYGAARRPLSKYLSRGENAQLPDPRSRYPFWSALESTKGLITIGAGRRDKSMLHRAVSRLEALAEEDPRNPAPHSYLVHAQSAMASVTGSRLWHRAAAASARESIRRGYDVAPMLHQLFEQSLASRDPADLRAALELAGERRIVPDLRCVSMFVEVALALGPDGDAAARAYLERARSYLVRPSEVIALDGLARRIASRS